MASISATSSGFGENVRRARLAKGWSQRQLGDKTGFGESLISRWENSRTTPGIDRITTLENVLGVTGLLLPSSEFVVKNQLYEIYPDMEYFPIITNNVDAYGIFEGKLFEQLGSIRQSVHYTHLCEFDKREGDPITDADPQYTPRELQSDLFKTRLLDGKISWERVEIFYSVGRLAQALKSQILLRGTRYEVKFYPTPPKSFPIINLRSFDHTRFLIGGYDPERVYRNNCIELGNKDPLRDFLVNYWDAVWVAGKPERLTFRKADEIFKYLNEITETEWNNVKAKILDETKPLAQLQGL